MYADVSRCVRELVTAARNAMASLRTFGDAMTEANDVKFNVDK